MAARSSKSLASCRRATSRAWTNCGLRVLGRILVFVEEDFSPQPVELGVDVVLARCISACAKPRSSRPRASSWRPTFQRAVGEHEEEGGRPEPVADARQVDHRLLHLRHARLARPRFDPRDTSEERSYSQPERKPELLGEAHELSASVPPSGRARHARNGRHRLEEGERQRERMIQSPRQRHRLARSRPARGRDGRGRGDSWPHARGR